MAHSGLPWEKFDGAVDRVEDPVGVLVAGGSVFFSDEANSGIPVA